MKQFLTVFILISLCKLISANPTVLFQDNFDSDLAQWQPLFQSQYQISGGNLTLTSTSSTGQSWVKKSSISAKNLVVKTTAVFVQADTNARAGVTVRGQDNASAYHFYIYPSGSFIVYRYSDGEWVDFSNHYLLNHSFIRNDTNEIAVMANDSSITFFCNGYKLTTIIDTGASAISEEGFVGLIVSGQCQTAFTEVIATTGDTVYAQSSFQDNFSSPTLIGWRNYGQIGTFSVNEGYLEAISLNSNNIASLLSDGNYGDSDTIEVTAIPQSPLPSGSYNFGVIFHYSSVLSTGGSSTTSAYHFVITNGTHFTLLKQNESGISMLFSPEISTSIVQSGENRLKVINHNSGLKELFINGTKVKEFTDNSFPSGGVGLMVNGGARILFGNFSVKGTVPLTNAIENDKIALNEIQNILAYPNPFNPILSIRLPDNKLSYSIEITDINGRIISTFKAVTGTMRWDASKQPSGIYFANIYGNNRIVSIKRLSLIR